MKPMMPTSGSRPDGRRALALACGLLLWAAATAAAAAGPLYWDWPAGHGFSRVEFEGAGVDAVGALVAGPRALAVGPTGPEVIWRVVPDGDGGFFSATGHGGQIHHADREGTLRLVAGLEATEVFSLLLLADGSLLAGCGPEGQVYRISPDGTATLAATVPGGYAWALLAGATPGEAWIAAGSPAAVYRLTADDELAQVAEFPALNCLDLAWAEDGVLLAATQGPGLIYRLETRGRRGPRLLYEAAQDEVRQFLRGPAGRVHALALDTGEGLGQENGPGEGGGGASSQLLSLLGQEPEDPTPRAALYRLEGDGRVLPVWTGTADLMIAAWSAEWGWLGGGPLAEGKQKAVLHRLTPPVGSHPVTAWEGGDVLDLQLVPEGILVAQAHPGGVTRLTWNGGPHRAVSAPVDGLRPVRWGRLRWDGQGGAGQPRWSVRGGNRGEPDDSWTDWSAAWSDRDRALELPPCRYLQWRVELPTDGGADDPWRVTEVSVSAWRDNLPPVIRSFDLEVLRGLETGGLVTHGENVTQTFDSGLRVEFSRAAEGRRGAEPGRSAGTRPVKVFTWEAADPDEDRLQFQLEVRRRGERSWRTILEETLETAGSWNTADVPDGLYEVRLTVDDGPDNPPGQAGRSQRLLERVRVDNTPPRIDDFRVTRQAGGLKLEFSAKDAAGPLAGATVEWPDGTRRRLDPIDRICDSPEERFSVELPQPEAGGDWGPEPWRVRVQVLDLGGNPAAAEGEAR